MNIKPLIFTLLLLPLSVLACENQRQQGMMMLVACTAAWQRWNKMGNTGLYIRQVS